MDTDILLLYEHGSEGVTHSVIVWPTNIIITDTFSELWLLKPHAKLSRVKPNQRKKVNAKWTKMWDMLNF